MPALICAPVVVIVYVNCVVCYVSNIHVVVIGKGEREREREIEKEREREGIEREGSV